MKKIDRTLGGKLEEIATIGAASFKDHLMDFGVHLTCESEIEGMLAASFVACNNLDYYNGSECRWRIFGWSFDDHASIEDLAIEGQEPNIIFVTPQVIIGGYRVDFLCYMRMFDWLDKRSKTVVVAIECDGHEFHEKTKEQAKRDKSRDRDLLIKGIPSMRFAGSEIWKDVFGCMRQIDKFFHDRLIAFLSENPIRLEDEL